MVANPLPRNPATQALWDYWLSIRYRGTPERGFDRSGSGAYQAMGALQ